MGSIVGSIVGGFNALVKGTLNVVGVLTAAAGVVGNVTGNLIGNVTGTLTGASNGTHTGPVVGTTVGAGTSLDLGGIMTVTETRPAAFVADQTDFAGSGSSEISIWTSDATPRTVNSRSIASGQRQTIINGNTVTPIIIGNSGAGTNKFLCPGGVNYSMGPGQGVVMYYSPAISKIMVIPFT